MDTYTSRYKKTNKKGQGSTKWAGGKRGYTKRDWKEKVYVKEMSLTPGCRPEEKEKG